MMLYYEDPQLAECGTGVRARCHFSDLARHRQKLPKTGTEHAVFNSVMAVAYKLCEVGMREEKVR